MAVKKIECEDCGFSGKVTYIEEKLTFSEISFCPVCSHDITEDYKDEDEADECDYDGYDRNLEED